MDKPRSYSSYLDIAISDLKVGDLILCENKYEQKFVSMIQAIIPSADDDIEGTSFRIDWYDDFSKPPLTINLPSFSTRVFRYSLLKGYGNLLPK